VRDALRPAFPHLAVLSWQEVNVDMDVQPFARVEFD
jgi:type III secretory pathway component EscV